MKLKNIKARDVIALLTRQGFEVKRQSGTHVILRKHDKTVVVPIHKAVIPVGTLKSIEKQAGLDFREILG
ncbi:MAG: type II toxin-antitoxin system HicA family toxin [Nanoarchaeota archaeon]